MRGFELLDKIELADLRYVQDADAPPVRRQQSWIRWGAVAACLCLIAAAALLLPKPAISEHPQPSVSASQGNSAPIIVDGSGFIGSETNASYRSPAPGTTLFFVEVAEAMDEYRGTDARLFLAIDIFDEAGPVSKGSKAMDSEIQRLTAMGFEVGWGESWTYQGEGEKIPQTYLYGLFTVEELESFSTGEFYGYSFYFKTNGDGSPAEYPED